VAVTGSFQYTANFGGGPLTSAGYLDIFVVKLTRDGTHLWSERIGSAQNDAGNGVATDSTGQVIVTGYFQGTVDFGGTQLISRGSSDIFLLKFGP